MTAAPAPFRPRALVLSELLDETFRLYRRNFTVLAGIALLTLIPSLAAQLLTGSYRINLVNQYIRALQNAAAGGTAPQPTQLDLGGFGIVFLIGVLILPFSVGSLYYAAVQVATGVPVTIASVLGAVLRRYFGIYGLAILAGLVGISFIFILTIPVVIWVLVRWMVALPALFAERVGPVAALGRSWNLVRDNWWRALGIFLVVLIMVSLVESALGLLFTGLAAIVPGVSDDLRGALVTVASTLVGALVQPLTPIALTLLYLDLRVRKEGYDLEQLAQQAAPGPA